jgi:F0F1-type ATP synthase assembly protein I
VADREEDKAREARRQAAAYQGAFEAVLAILIAAGLGYWADEVTGSSPRYLLIGVVIGFASFVLRLVRLGRHVGDASGGGEGARRERARDEERS